MVQTGENCSTWRKSCPCGNLDTKNPTLKGLEQNPAFIDGWLDTQFSEPWLGPTFCLKIEETKIIK
jgi:hypothetical protein